MTFCCLVGSTSHKELNVLSFQSVLNEM